MRIRLSAPSVELPRTIAKAAMVVSLTLPISDTLAGPYVTQGPFVEPSAGSLVPGPTQVPGKEYSNHLDRNGYIAAGDVGNYAANPEQIIAWDGAGGTGNTFNFLFSRPEDTLAREVDALANAGDKLYTEVTHDEAALLFSTSTDASIYFEDAKFGSLSPPTGGLWAAPLQIDQVAPDDVDGLEVWGDDGPGKDDGNRYSLTGDPVGAPRVAVWEVPLPAGPAPGNATDLWTVQELAAAIAPLVGVSSSELLELFDLDAMITAQTTASDVFVADEITFSIAPITTLGIDGGEIFVVTRPVIGDVEADFLKHGGHLWNTAFDVMGTFGTVSENINALEAVATVPEPGSMVLFCVGLVGLSVMARRRRDRRGNQ